MFDLSSEMQDRSQAKDVGVRNLSHFFKVQYVIPNCTWVWVSSL
jgi:hypothetical protein